MRGSGLLFPLSSKGGVLVSETYFFACDKRNILSAMLTIGADDDFVLYVNGQFVFADLDLTAETAPFTLDIQPFLHIGENTLAIYARDAVAIGYEWVLVDGTIRVNLSGIKGDYNSDGCVDRNDLNTLLSELRISERKSLVFDLNQDKVFNVSDARYLTTLFTHPRGAECPE